MKGIFELVKTLDTLLISAVFTKMEEGREARPPQYYPSHKRHLKEGGGWRSEVNDAKGEIIKMLLWTDKQLHFSDDSQAFRTAADEMHRDGLIIKTGENPAHQKYYKLNDDSPALDVVIEKALAPVLEKAATILAERAKGR